MQDQSLWAAAITCGLLLAGFRRVPVPRGNSYRRDLPSDDARGRLAETPSAIPARGWKDILLRVYHNISEHRVIALAAGVTFYSLLAIFPAIAALVAVFGLFADPNTLTTQIDKVAGLLPGGALEIIRDQFTRVASQGRGTLGATFGVSLAISLWSASAAVKSIFDTLNIVYAEPEKARVHPAEYDIARLYRRGHRVTPRRDRGDGNSPASASTA